MNRRLRTNVPISREARIPLVPDKTLLLEREEELRRKQKCNFNRRHRARDLSPALPGNVVWLPDRRERGTIGDKVTPRSYQVETPSGAFRRNRRDIIRLPTEEGSPGIQDSDQETTSDDQSRTGGESRTPPVPPPRRSTRITYKPDYYDPCAM